MTRDEIIQLAKESGLLLGHSFAWEHLERFAAFVTAIQREKDAKICDTLSEDNSLVSVHLVARRLARDIRNQQP